MNNLPILRQENIQLIVTSAPKAFEENKNSSLKCNEFGQSLLAKIQSEGMNDELDQKSAVYIEKAKRTVKTMNERRSPFTKLFDQIRSEFTVLENSIDPAKTDTIPFQIQKARDSYALKKRLEAERIRQEELRRQQREAAIAKYRQDCNDDYKRQFDNQITTDINLLNSLNQSLSLDNFETKAAEIKAFSIEIGNEWFQHLQSYAHKPLDINDGEAIQMRQEILNSLVPVFREQYKFEIGEYRDSIVDTLPAKKQELERMAQADAAEKERLAAELKAREAAEAQRLDAERRRRDEEAKASSQLKSQVSEMDGLFGQAALAAAPAGYQPKTSVKYRVSAVNAEGMLAIFSFWWAHEGKKLPVDELTKIFKKQITYCEKVANDKDKPEFISSVLVIYDEEVKAK